MSAKTVLRNGIARFLFSTGITDPARRSNGSLAIATFHRVLPEAERQAYPYPGLVVTPQELEALLAYLTEHFDCGALRTQHDRYLRGDGTRPLLALTFDDGQFDNFLNARPVLDRYQVKASFFIPVAAVEQQQLLWHDRIGFAVRAMLDNGRDGLRQLKAVLVERGFSVSPDGSRSMVSAIVREAKALAVEPRLELVQSLVEASGAVEAPEFARLMTFTEIADLAADGHEIGSHSMTHCMMTECDDRTLAYELSESRRILQDRVGQAVESFCYPNGNCDHRTASAVSKAGYMRAVSTRWGINGIASDPFQLRRHDMDASRMRDSAGQILPPVVAFRMSGLYPGLS